MAHGFPPPDALAPQDPLTSCYERSVPLAERPVVDRGPLLQRMLQYAQLALKHRVSGLASYYSSFFDGRKTANGEIFRNQKYSAAHLTLPLGTWVEVKSRATGRTLRLRVIALPGEEPLPEDVELEPESELADQLSLIQER